MEKLTLDDERATIILGNSSWGPQTRKGSKPVVQKGFFEFVRRRFLVVEQDEFRTSSVIYLFCLIGLILKIYSENPAIPLSTVSLVRPAEGPVQLGEEPPFVTVRTKLHGIKACYRMQGLAASERAVTDATVLIIIFLDRDHVGAKNILRWYKCNEVTSL